MNDKNRHKLKHLSASDTDNPQTDCVCPEHAVFALQNQKEQQ